MLNLVKALLAVFPKNQGFWRRIIGEFREDLVSPKNRSARNAVGDLRFELRTSGLRVRCSTVELVTLTKTYSSRLLTLPLVLQLKNWFKGEFDCESDVIICVYDIN